MATREIMAVVEEGAVATEMATTITTTATTTTTTATTGEHTEGNSKNKTVMVTKEVKVTVATDKSSKTSNTEATLKGINSNGTSNHKATAIKKIATGRSHKIVKMFNAGIVKNMGIIASLVQNSSFG